METVFTNLEESSAPAPRLKLKEDLRLLAQDTEDLLKATAGDVSAKVAEARARVKEALVRARESCQELEAKTVATARATDGLIRGHPYEAIGLGLLAGVLVGTFVLRR